MKATTNIYLNNVIVAIICVLTFLYGDTEGWQIFTLGFMICYVFQISYILARLARSEDVDTSRECEPSYDRTVSVKFADWVSEAFKKHVTDNLGYKTPGSAGIDLIAPSRLVFPATGEVVTVRTGICVQSGDSRIHAIVLPRSGLGSAGLRIMNTVPLIDNDYTGEIILKMSNVGTEAIEVDEFGRYAQIVFLPVLQAELAFTDTFEETVRGEGGFGSTGI